LDRKEKPEVAHDDGNGMSMGECETFHKSEERSALDCQIANNAMSSVKAVLCHESLFVSTSNFLLLLLLHLLTDRKSRHHSLPCLFFQPRKFSRQVDPFVLFPPFQRPGSAVQTCLKYNRRVNLGDNLTSKEQITFMNFLFEYFL
jgi:hypothetical protein